MPPPPPAFTASGLTPLTGTDPGHIGRYRVAGRLGAGGMGTVYAAVDRRGAPAAVKVVHREYAADTQFRKRFAREVELMRRVGGACLPDFYDADPRAQQPWLATEYVPGLTLGRHLGRHGPLTGGTLCGTAAGVAEALAAVHAAGIVHRDLKPGNVLLSPAGPKVLDFGIARAVEESAITRTGGLMGTPGWIAPERYRGAEPASEADMFAWGALVAFAATGRRIFGTGAPDTVAMRVMDEEPVLDGVPEFLLPIVAAALSKDPARRPSAAEALAAVTAQWADDRAASASSGPRAPADADTATRMLPVLLERQWSVPADPSGPDSTSWDSLAPPRRAWWRSRRVLLTAAASLALVLFGGAGFLGWRTLSDAPAGEAAAGQAGGGSASAPAPTPTADPPDLERGGPNLVGGQPGEDLGLGAVKVEAVEPDTVELATAAQHGDTDAVGAWEPRLRIRFASAAREGSDLVFTGSAQYLRDKGSYTLHSADFSVITRKDGAGSAPIGSAEAGSGKVAAVQPASAPAAGIEPAQFLTFDHYPAADTGILTTLTPETPTGEFSITVPGVPEEGGLAEDRLVTSRYVRYEAPPELWGYTVADEDWTPGVLCYLEGGPWHDIPVFSYTEMPCG